MGQAAHGSLEQSLIHDSRYHDTLRESEYPISRVLSPRRCSKLPQKNSPWLPGASAALLGFPGLAKLFKRSQAIFSNLFFDSFKQSFAQASQDVHVILDALPSGWNLGASAALNPKRLKIGWFGMGVTA